MPVPPLRFSTGDVAYVRPATPDRRVTLLGHKMHRSPQGVQFPHWLVRDDAGDEFTVSQIELSSRATTIKNGSVKLLTGAVK